MSENQSPVADASLSGAQRRSIPILLVEDDDVDVEAVRRALGKASIENPLHIAHDGIEALDLLWGRSGKRGLPQPCLILLDINMPRLSGLQFLAVRAGDISLKQNIVFVLTTSDHDQDKMNAYGRDIAGYMQKRDLGKLVGLLKEYLDINRMPDNTN
ncbi:MAG TPA: response regulator [Steroidobacteraceae bacterium]|nr:response regulator [Steroidobacteraceae bacterium]